MSTRFYPRFVKGNPQLRIFLPDWKFVMIKSDEKVSENVVTFKTDPRMTDWDIKNYLEKIYKVQVASVKSRILAGDLKRVKEGLAKWEDYKIAYVTLPVGQRFKWPDLFPEEKSKEAISDYKRNLKEVNKGRKMNPSFQDLPNWLVGKTDQ